MTGPNVCPAESTAGVSGPSVVSAECDSAQTQIAAAPAPPIASITAERSRSGTNASQPASRRPRPLGRARGGEHERAQDSVIAGAARPATRRP